MAPVVHGLEAEYQDRVQFTYLDMDDPATEPLRRQLGFQWRPHFFLLNGDGAVLRQWVGLVEEPELRAALEAALQE